MDNHVVWVTDHTESEWMSQVQDLRRLYPVVEWTMVLLILQEIPVEHSLKSKSSSHNSRSYPERLCRKSGANSLRR